MKTEKAILSIHHLKARFRIVGRDILAVRDVNLEVKPSSIVALVGESGSGKSVTALSILGLLDPRKTVVKGEIWFGDVNLLQLPEKQLRKIRGRDIAMIFQDPMNALNPVLTIGQQMVETIRLHHRFSRSAAKEFALRQLKKVGLPDAEHLMQQYAFQISGGMCQRVMIAMALVCGARLLIADEPTTALDVIVQAQILEELERLRCENGISILLITHDLGVVAEMADDVYVMKEGRVVESGDVWQIFQNPSHPYTQQLLSCRQNELSNSVGVRNHAFARNSSSVQTI